MNRREFLRRALSLTAPALILPAAARTIFLPPRGGWLQFIGRQNFDNVAYVSFNMEDLAKMELPDIDLTAMWEQYRLKPQWIMTTEGQRHVVPTIWAKKVPEGSLIWDPIAVEEVV